jgi:hypothetical protein
MCPKIWKKFKKFRAYVPNFQNLVKNLEKIKKLGAYAPNFQNAPKKY